MIELDFRLDTSNIDNALNMRLIDQELAQRIFALDLSFRNLCDCYLGFRQCLLLGRSKKISDSAESGSGKI